MFNSRDLLGAMLGSGMGGRNPRMAGLGYGGGGGGMPGSGGGLGGLGSILGGAGAGGGGLGGMLGGAGGGLGGLGGRGMQGGGLGGMLGGGRTGGGMGGMQGALLGVLGGIAMSALQRRMQQASTQTAQSEPDPSVAASHPASTMRPTSPTMPSVPDVTEAGSISPEQTSEVDEGRARLLVRVMVAAANADMRIDDQERSRILGKLEESGADQAAKSFVEQEMRSPMSIDDIAREVSGPDVAAQVYAAALAAIDVDKAMERSFLASLAQRLGLDAEIVGEIHDQLGQPRPA